MNKTLHRVFSRALLPRIPILVAILSCAAQTLPRVAAEGPPDDTKYLVDIAVTSASGAERYPECLGGRIDRIGLAPGQTVTVGMTYRGERSGEMFVSALDGGEVSTEGPLIIENGARVHFQYRGGEMAGRYRVVAEIEDEKYCFDFYVLNMSNPANNPPRVRIVE